MRLPGRRSEASAPEGSDAEQQGAWDEDSAAHRGRLAALALGLAALLVAGVLVVARARGGGNVLALGSSPTSSATPAAEDLDPLSGDLRFQASQAIAPGDPLVPEAAQPAAGGPPDPAAAAAGQADGGGAAGGTSEGSGAAGSGGDGSGGSGGAGVGIPIPTTSAGGGAGDGGGTATTQSNPPASTTTAVPGAPPPPPSCGVTHALARDNPMARQGAKKLAKDIHVEFRPTSCGSAFRVEVNGKNEPATAAAGGLFVATIPGSDPIWGKGSFPITVRTTGGTVIATIAFTVS